MGQLSLRFGQCFLGAVSIGDVDYCSDVFDKVPGLVESGVGPGVDISHHSVWTEDSKFELVITFLSNCFIKRMLKYGPVVAVDPLKKQRISRLHLFRIEAKDAKMFLGPEQISGGDIPGPTACVADSLPLSQIGFTSPHHCFHALALERLCSLPGIKIGQSQLAL